MHTHSQKDQHRADVGMWQVFGWIQPVLPARTVTLPLGDGEEGEGLLSVVDLESQVNWLEPPTPSCLIGLPLPTSSAENLRFLAGTFGLRLFHSKDPRSKRTLKLFLAGN